MCRHGPFSDILYTGAGSAWTWRDVGVPFDRGQSAWALLRHLRLRANIRGMQQVARMQQVKDWAESRSP